MASLKEGAWQSGWAFTGVAAISAPFVASQISPAVESSQMAPPTHGKAGATMPTSAYVDDRLLKAELTAVEARTDTKFSQLIGKLDIIGERITGLHTQVAQLDVKVTNVDDHSRNGRNLVIATALGTGIAVAALAFAAVQIFQGGMGASASAFQSGLGVAQGSPHLEVKQLNNSKH